jgi:iron(II)-dependent oxidoreductase
VAQARSQQEQTARLAAPSAARPQAADTPVTVFAHRTGHDEADARIAEQLMRVLPAARFQVAARIEPREAKVCGDLRFHHDQDAEAAREALELLNRELERRRDPRLLQLNDRRSMESAASVKRGTLEVWLPPMTDAPTQRVDRWGASRLVPAGCTLIGSDPKDRETLRRGLGAADAKHFATELPVRREWIDAFYIGRTEVTARAFAAYQAECERSRGAACPPWRLKYLDPKAEPDRPATFVTWEQARDYCRWAGGRLPSDLEWEKAARGTDGRFWPWGFQPDDTRFQGKSRSPDRPVNVGSFPAGDSPYGVADMAGNVYEYTADLWDSVDHSFRGGSYLNTLMESRASVRWASEVERRNGAEYLGFRCVAELER